ncbi:vWA domain-containing protein [Desulfoglaeba alkanexedens]|uniref:VWA domain-containing protein n=1 Tax=Desulfoglaeba alkanexedens ALDC TaxID=980445 RepID=A0A4P8L514_9BACT|nr:vWA domain-containing protein [Desulfoglaeba alkanexedens]QCQ23058.1 hypothetical protein FDQ92_13285 [Desulfoglaeba alkanexedens ALDC]
MKTYSLYWRKNTSKEEAVELALCLRSLRKVASHLGYNVKPVYWEGMVDSDERSILLDPAAVRGKYPIPFNKYDILVGQVILEGKSSMEWREWVIGKVVEEAGELSGDAEAILLKIAGAAEDIYVTEWAKSHVWRHYLRRFWEARLSAGQRDPALPPTADSLADMWRREVLLGRTSRNLHQYYHGPLALLNAYTAKIANCLALAGVGRRRDYRKNLYHELWARLFEAIQEWESFQLSPDAVGLRDEMGVKGEVDVETDTPRRSTDLERNEDLEEDVIDKLNSILEADDTIDLTSVVSAAVEDPEAAPIKTVFSKSAVPSDMMPDKVQTAVMKKLFRDQELFLRRRQMRGATRRGLTEGKLDARRLYRVPLDGKVFKNRECTKTRKAWHICIVVDASASMSGRGEHGSVIPWELAERTFVSLAEAIKGSKNTLDIHAYCERGGQCVITNLFHGGRVHTVVPSGRTPSGQAILGAAAMMEKGHPQNMMIHITDGAANCGLSLGDAVRFCRKNNIRLFTIGCGCNQQTQDFLSGYFPAESLFFMKDMGDLAIGLYEVFRRNIFEAV